MKRFVKQVLFVLIGIVSLLVGISSKSLMLDKRVTQDVQGLSNVAINTPTLSITDAPIETTTPTPTNTPTRKPIPTLVKSTPTPFPTSQSNLQTRYVPVTQSPTQNIQTNSQDDAYLEYLHEQQAENERKRVYCQELYASVTASLQPLLAHRDSINQQYSDAIEQSNISKISQYQQELADVQSQITATYNQQYYSVCP